VNKRVSISILLLVFGIFSAGVVAAPTVEVHAQQSSLPQIAFLGQGPGTFSVEPPLKLLVKTYVDGQFLFVMHEEASYRAARAERVWSVDWLPEESIRLFDEGRSYGQRPAGCVVNYVQIEDNPDDRRNTFYINGNVLQVVEQGWVTYGSLTIPEDGELTFYAEDSVGLIVTPCLNQPEETATPTAPVPGDTATPTAPAEPTETATLPPVGPTPTNTVPPVGPTATNTVPPVGPTATSTPPGVVVTVAPTSTPTNPGVPPTDATPTNTPPGVVVTVAPTSTPTNPGVPPAAGTVTRTPAPTAGVIPVSGGEPGPRELAGMGLALAGGMAMLAFAWRALLRASRSG
jgi:hypothetical protein